MPGKQGKLSQVLFLIGFCSLLICASSGPGFPLGPESLEYMDTLPVLRDPVIAREASTHDRKGGNDNGFTNKAEWVRRQRGMRVVILDVEGPGCINSFWYSWPNQRALPGWVDKLWARMLGHVEIYIDREDEPSVDVPLKSLIGACPNCYPLAVRAEESTGGYISYVPILFEKGVKVVVDGAGLPMFFYHFWYHTYPYGTEVDSYTGNEDLSSALDEWNPENIGPIPEGRLWDAEDVIIGPRAEEEIAGFNSPGIIRSIRMRLPEDDEALRAIRLVIYWDGDEDDERPSVDAPLSLFYAIENRFSKEPEELADNALLEGLVIGQDKDGLWYFNLPMPFREKAKLVLANDGDKAVRVENIKIEIENKLFPGLGTRAGYFRTHFNQSNDLVPNRDYLLAHLHGRGQIVGTVLAVEDTPETFLEGDERIYVDGSRYPLIMGDATETYFNGSWYFSETAFSCPLHGAPTFRIRKREIGACSDVTMYRFHLSDLVPFRSEVRFSIQHGPLNNVYGNYRSLVFYYGLDKRVLFASDMIKMGDVKNLAEHGFEQVKQGRVVEREGFFEGEFDGSYLGELKRPGWIGPGSWMLHLTVRGFFSSPRKNSPDKKTFLVREDNSAYEFTVRIDPENQGLLLRRLFDQGIPDQRAKIEVDGEPAGIWFNAGRNKWKIWAEDEFMIGTELTAGKDEIMIRITPLSPVFTACEYQVLSLVLNDE